MNALNIGSESSRPELSVCWFDGTQEKCNRKSETTEENLPVEDPLEAQNRHCQKLDQEGRVGEQDSEQPNVSHTGNFFGIQPEKGSPRNAPRDKIQPEELEWLRISISHASCQVNIAIFSLRDISSFTKAYPHTQEEIKTILAWHKNSQNLCLFDRFARFSSLLTRST
jgi:hypothetical protein